jgi:hypothetical protein
MLNNEEVKPPSDTLLRYKKEYFIKSSKFKFRYFISGKKVRLKDREN